MDDNNQDDKKILFFPIVGGLQSVKLCDIVFCKGLGSQTELHIDKKEIPEVVCYTLKELEKKLPDNRFLRIHKSYIINFHHIVKCMTLKDPEVYMSNNKIVTASRNKKMALLNKLKEAVLSLIVFLHCSDWLPDDFSDWNQWTDITDNFDCIMQNCF